MITELSNMRHMSEITSGFLLGVDSRIAEEDPQPNRGILKGHPVGG